MESQPNEIGETNMKVHLVFDDVPDDLEGAIADIRVEDQSKADAPSLLLSSRRVGPFAIRHSRPEITLDVDLTIPNNGHEPSLFVRVEAHTLSKKTTKFLNTTTVALSEDPNALVTVPLERIM
jgi:hypothetical protein